MNEREELAYGVESVVIFGSYLTKREQLNDLDLSVELSRRGQDEATDEKLNKERLASERAGDEWKNALTFAVLARY
jgi:predicted nucleotidyltransferase